MRSLAKALFLSICLGIAAYLAVFFWQKHRIDVRHEHLTTFQWFNEEFDVTKAQQEKIEALHTAYFPECEDHCIHYADTKRTLAQIAEDPGLDQTPEHVDAARRLAELEKEADKKFIDFVYSVAAEMNPEASARYLARMKGWLDQSTKLATD
ncbi:hypothetical protein VSU19_22030 [Verrucomicrobiales bacterium BCK34]|nr:hypothetical protein [Verrucomicrobiales bacterium BCK34]